MKLGHFKKILQEIFFFSRVKPSVEKQNQKKENMLTRVNKREKINSGKKIMCETEDVFVKSKTKKFKYILFFSPSANRSGKKVYFCMCETEFLFLKTGIPENFFSQEEYFFLSCVKPGEKHFYQADCFFFMCEEGGKVFVFEILILTTRG